MAKKLYVGNLAWATTDKDLEVLFSEAGTVLSAKVMSDKMTGRSRGFGFVEMEDSDADGAVEKINSRDLGGRKIIVNEARPMTERSDDRSSERRRF